MKKEESLIKCAVIGGSALSCGPCGEQLREIQKLSEWFAKSNTEVLTGACGGFPYIVGKECIRCGAVVTGYSPARNYEEHLTVYSHPVDGCTRFKYMGLDAPVNQNFLQRSLPLIADADAVICFEGNWGTLFELTTGVICGKTLIICNGYGGISAEFEQLYLSTSKNCKYSYGEKVFFPQDMNELIICLQKLFGNFSGE